MAAKDLAAHEEQRLTRNQSFDRLEHGDAACNESDLDQVVGDGLGI